MKYPSPESIERTTQEVLRQAGELAVHTNVYRVAESLGVHIHDEELESDVSGVLIVKGDERHVLVNKAHSETRKRFTIAHELGHLLLHDNPVEGGASERVFIDKQIRVYQRTELDAPIYKQEGSMTDVRQEREANSFAACLLMPMHHVTREALERDLFDEVSVASLARAFGVSEQAMSIRLQQLKVLSPGFVPSSSDKQLPGSSTPGAD